MELIRKRFGSKRNQLTYPDQDLLRGFLGRRTRHTCHQAPRIHTQHGGEGEDAEQADVAFTAFDRAHVRPVQAGPVRQFLLGQSPD